MSAWPGREIIIRLAGSRYSGQTQRSKPGTCVVMGRSLFMSLGPGQVTARDQGKTKRMPSGFIISSSGMFSFYYRNKLENIYYM